MKNNINSISVYGDSILKGAVTGTPNKRFEIVKENSLALAAEQLQFTLNNYSVFGNILPKAQKKMIANFEKGLTTDDVVIIESGGNDSDYDWISLMNNPESPKLPRTTLNDFMKILDEMVQLVRKNKMTPLLMTMPPLVPERWFKTICATSDEKMITDFLGGDIQKLYRTHELYSLNITEYAWKNNVQFIDMRKAMLELPDYHNEMCADGIHPNVKGYAYMATIFEKELPLLKKEF